MSEKSFKSDFKKIDSFFSEGESFGGSKKKQTSKHTKAVRMIKLLLPGIAAALLGLLIIYPKIMREARELKLDITAPKKGELEKLHIENTVFYVTDKNNKVHNFTAENIDETAPGSKLIKIINPEGILPLNLESWFNIKSPTGYFDQNQNTLTLTEDVEMFYSDGMNIDIFDITYDFKNSRGYSESPVKADGFMGNLTSEGLEFFSETGILIFKGKTFIKINEENLK